MGREPKNVHPSTPPKLSLYSLPSKPQAPVGLLTPPLQAPASVPFGWEEAPGKPRECLLFKPKAARCLELPPRLLAAEGKSNDSTSPTTVLDGPQVGRSLSFSLSFRKGSFRREAKEGQFGSRRWSASNKENREVGGSFEFPCFMAGESVGDKDSPNSRGDRGSGGAGNMGRSSCAAAVPHEEQNHGDAKVKITRMKRKGSLFSLSRGSQMWASIYKSFKQVVPWRSSQPKLKKNSSCTSFHFH